MKVNTSLTANTKCDTGISCSCVEVYSWANTSIPTQIRDGVDVEMCLIKCGKGQPANARPAAITEISFQAVDTTKSLLE